MEKRLILAIALSLLVLLTWSALAPKTQQPVNKEVTTSTAPSSQTLPPPAPAFKTETELPPSSLYKYDQEKFEITFVEPQAAIKEIKFKAHQDYKFALRYGLALADNALSFKRLSSSADTVTFVHSDQNKKIIKRFIFFKSSYSILLEIEVQNVSNTAMKLNFPLILGTLDLSPHNSQARYQDITAATQDKVLHLSARKDLEFSGLKFLGFRDKYFCAIVQPAAEVSTGFIKKIDAQTAELGISFPENLLASTQQIKQTFRIYLGPQELRTINSINPAWAAIVHYGTFDFIAQIIVQALEVLYRLLHNWGWAIVILSLLVYLLLYPLTLKQMRSMKEMQVLQPRIEELRKLYKDNPQRMNKEVMELYRLHKVNPLGGCLPLILQMPIFIALWQALQRSIALKGAKFLWIKDLSEPDRLFALNSSWLIKEINILPILTAILMFIQQKISTAPAGGSGAEQQKLMAVMVPIIFGFAFYNMPSGWVLYFFVYSVLMLIYQFRITRKR